MRKSRGVTVDKDSRGISHFTALGGRLKPEAPEFGAILFIEPLIAIVIAYLFFKPSFFFGVIFTGVAARFWYENYLLYQKSLASKPQAATTDTSVMAASASAMGFANAATINGETQQAPQEQAKKEAENPSFTTMVYYAIGERLDKYLAENQEKVSTTPFLQKIQQFRTYFKSQNINRRKSINFFISALIVFIGVFIAAIIDGQWSSLIVAPIGMVVLWSSYLAFSQIKILDKLINEVMSWAYLLGMGLIPVPVRNVLTGIVKLILFAILAFRFPYVGIAYLIYRIVIPFLDLKALPSFEKA